MRVRRIDHIVLDVADTRRSVAWYRDKLGLEPERYEEWQRGEVVFTSLRIDDDAIIDLFETAPTGENMNHLCLVVDDIDLDVAAV